MIMFHSSGKYEAELIKLSDEADKVSLLEKNARVSTGKNLLSWPYHTYTHTDRKFQNIVKTSSVAEPFPSIGTINGNHPIGGIKVIFV